MCFGGKFKLTVPDGFEHQWIQIFHFSRLASSPSVMSEELPGGTPRKTWSAPWPLFTGGRGGKKGKRGWQLWQLRARQQPKRNNKTRCKAHLLNFSLSSKWPPICLQHCLQPWLEGLTTGNNEVSAHGSPLMLYSLLERFHIGLENGAGLPLHFTPYCEVQWWEIQWRYGPHSPWPEVHKMLLAPMLDQLTFVRRCWILLPRIPTAWVHGIQPRLYHCLQDIDVDLSVDFEALGEPVRRHLFPITCDYT